MSKLTKNKKLALAKIENGKAYTIDEAAQLVKEITFTKFDASVDIDVRLGVDPRKANQMVRGVVTLPHGTGKEIRVLVLCTPDKAEEAKAAGADYVGLEEYIEKLKSGWTDVDIVTQSDNLNPAGGIVGNIMGTSTISNCFSLGDVINNGTDTFCYSGGIAGIAEGTIENCYTSSKVFSACGVDHEYVIASNDSAGNNTGPLSLAINNVTYESNANPGMALYDNSLQLTSSGVTSAGITIPDITLQVGIGSDTSSQITFSTAFSISGLSSDIENPNLLTTLDEIIESLSNKQTELGSVQNRLESVLEEISIHYDNLVSSRSTIRDADIAEESSQYIKMQILQQASATLLATVNQTPAITLQLL